MDTHGNRPGAALVPAAPERPTEVVRVAGGAVSGRVDVAPDGELVVRVRPSQVRDVTTRPLHPAAEPVHRHHRGCSCRYGTVLAYVGPFTPDDRVREAAAWARWMDPPWWAAVRWIPEQRRLRAELRAAPSRRAVTGPRPRELEPAPGAAGTRWRRWTR